MRVPNALILPAALVLSVSAEWGAFGGPTRWVPDVLVGWSFIGGGALCAARGPDSRVAVLMTATGFTWFLGNFSAVGPDIVAWSAGQATFLHRGPLVHLILSYPRGRLTSRVAQVGAAVGYAGTLVPLAWDSGTGTAFVSGLVVLASVHEYRQALGPSRRRRLLAVWAAIALAVAFVGGHVARSTFPSGLASHPVLLAYEAMLCAIAGSLCVGLMTADWERANVVDLIVELGSAGGRTLKAELVRALGDPSLDVGYRLAESESFVDEEGREIIVPSRATDRSVTVVGNPSEPVAVIVHDPAVLDDPRLVDAVTTAVELAAANARLLAEVRSRVAEVRESRRRIVDAEDEERHILERRLHDGAERRLQELGGSLRSIRASAHPDARRRLVRAEDQLLGTLDDLRQLAQGLSPRVLGQQGLESAIKSLADLCPVPVEVAVAVDRIPESVGTAVYFVCAEALANVAKHASAARATVTVANKDDTVTVVVSDDGVGGADSARGSGLLGVADRIAGLGGVLRVASVPGGGTTLAASLPVGSEGRDSPERSE